ncbi:1042_t:CDS:2, partial [Gigaspora margarita]
AQYEENKNRIDQAEMSSGTLASQREREGSVQTKKSWGSKTPKIKETENPYLERQMDSTEVINYAKDHNTIDGLNIDNADHETKDTNKKAKMQGTAMETSSENTNQDNLSEKAPKLIESLEIGEHLLESQKEDWFANEVASRYACPEEKV